MLKNLLSFWQRQLTKSQWLVCFQYPFGSLVRLQTIPLTWDFHLSLSKNGCQNLKKYFFVDLFYSFFFFWGDEICQLLPTSGSSGVCKLVIFTVEMLMAQYHPPKKAVETIMISHQPLRQSLDVLAKGIILMLVLFCFFFFKK